MTRICHTPRCVKASGNSFANVISGWTVQSDQSTTGASTYVAGSSNFRASDLQVSAVTTTGSATRAFSMAHQMGLANIKMKTWTGVKNVVFYIGSPSAAADVNYTWDNQETTDVTSSSTYTSSAKPYQGTSHWYIMSANTTFTTSATQTGVANYAGVGASAATVNADVRNNNAWTKTIDCTKGKCTEYTPTITATSYLSRVPYTLEYGDALYSDGALSKTSSSSYFWSGRTAIAYVTSIGKGGDHGYAMALRSAGTYYWSPYTNDSPLPNKNCIQALEDYAGYSNTQTLVNAANSSTYYPGAYAAWNYNARNKANTGTVSLTANLASRHWFLPSAGQLRDIIVYIVGLSTTPSKYLETDVCWEDTDGATLFYQRNNAILARFTSAGYTIDKYTEALSNSDTSACLLASTEYSAKVGFHTHPYVSNNIWLCNASSPDDYNDNKTGRKKTARPCVAF